MASEKRPQRRQETSATDIIPQNSKKSSGFEKKSSEDGVSHSLSSGVQFPVRADGRPGRRLHLLRSRLCHKPLRQGQKPFPEDLGRDQIPLQDRNRRKQGSTIAGAGQEGV